MRAVLEAGGKQYWVKPGDILSVEKCSGAIGESVTFGPLLWVQKDEKTISDPTELKDSKAVCKILAHGRGEKIIVFKKKRRKNYRRTQGHRQSFTRLKVIEISCVQSGEQREEVENNLYEWKVEINGT